MVVDGLAASHARPTRWLAADAILYAVAALFAGHAYAASSFVDYRTWAACAWPSYALSAAGATLLCITRPALSRRRLIAARAILAAVVLAGALVLPLGLEVRWRFARGSEYVASEVLVTEDAARELLHGRSPYAAHFRSHDLSWRTASIADHFPYLPGMAIAGLSHAVAPRRAWTDARLSFGLITLVAAGLALAQWRGPPDRRLTALQLLVLLPTGAALLATGGDDVPVLALTLLALVLLHEGRSGRALVAAAVAGGLKLTAWPLLFTLPAVTRRACATRRALMRSALAVVIPLALALGAAAPAPASFAEDVVLFPLGLTASPTPAHSATLGRLLLSSLGDLPPDSSTRLALTAVLLATAVLVCACLLLRLASRSDPRCPSAAAALTAAGISLVLILLAPIGRSGYLVYPLDLAIWGALLRDSPAVGRARDQTATYARPDDGRPASAAAHGMTS